MTVIEAMKQTVDENGDIVIPVGSMRGETEQPGTISEETVRTLFGDQVDLSLPLTEAQYSALVATVPGQWEQNWQWYRDNAVITVQG